MSPVGKSEFAVFLILLLPVVRAGGASAVEPAEGPIQTGKGHPFACTDYSQKKVFLVSAEGKVNWEYATGPCNDLWVLPSGNLLFNTGHGVMEVRRDKKVAFSFESKSEIYACQRLANGNTLIGECNAGRLIELDLSRQVVFQLRLVPEGTDAGHVYMRNARKLANGNFLVAHYGEQKVREYDPQGRIVLELDAPGGPHSVVRLLNGNTLIACGDVGKAAQVIEVDGKNRIVWSVVHDELPGMTLYFMSGLQRLPNGNTVMSNWLGHGNFGKAPQLIEVTPDKKVVWTFAGHRTIKTISSVQLLDVPGDATKGEILH